MRELSENREEIVALGQRRREFEEETLAVERSRAGDSTPAQKSSIFQSSYEHGRQEPGRTNLADELAKPDIVAIGRALGRFLLLMARPERLADGRRRVRAGQQVLVQVFENPLRGAEEDPAFDRCRRIRLRLQGARSLALSLRHEVSGGRVVLVREPGLWDPERLRRQHSRKCEIAVYRRDTTGVVCGHEEEHGFGVG